MTDQGNNDALDQRTGKFQPMMMVGQVTYRQKINSAVHSTS
jgi:hypothetical protein